MPERWVEAKTYVVNLKKASKRLHNNGDTKCKQTEVTLDWIQALENHNKRNDVRWKRPLAKALVGGLQATLCTIINNIFYISFKK